MNTRFVSVNPPIAQHPGVARAEEAASSLREVALSLAQVLSAGLAQGWQAMCRRAAEAHGAAPAQIWPALRRPSEAREDARFWAMAERDPRVMHELQVAISRRSEA
ncbi:hypothetical protein [Ottowia sp.]|uniref:hypothetical protein n=1 Tax=Ottowia sp. TaxID=1898956 RepID=UPI0039E4138D